MALIVGLLAVGPIAGCGKDEPKPPPAEVKTFEAYGVTLDPSASPQQVTYVLLRSIVDDYAAVRTKDAAAQRKAQLVAYSLAAPKTIEDRLVRTANAINPDLKKSGLGNERDEKISKATHYWAPIVGHYLPSFASADLKTVIRESWATISADGKRSNVYYPVSHDPSAEPAKAETATIDVELVREAAQAGGPEYWRVASVRFLSRQIPPPAETFTVQADGLTLDESATPQQVASVMLKSLAQLVQADKSHNADLRASAMYRAYCLANPTQVRARAAAGTGAGTDALAAAVKMWGTQVAPVMSSINMNAAPDRMQIVNNPDGTADASCPLPGPASPAVTVQLAPVSFAGKKYWRVVDVREFHTQMLLLGSGTTQVSTAPASGPAK